ncbi:MAG: CoB--CoM heterodisulfide reductase iron-sulfur subunit A family protein [Candidatus Bathyarchaeota archaeon]|nr:CoB--CoM heterodisulfide reductase iron-sulfur subunit A family protein [Candidatus Bathyarchaeota archaeon]MDH5732640.1 CoB--CoM heterodisulfide reductase iron-sulfur subunit A family protein [Candidatus Bathyarchaeota archaeon]
MSEEPRVGVFVCHCGLNIAGVIDVEEVTEYAKTLPNVVLAVHNRYICTAPGQAEIRTAIKEHKLNRVVVAACSPRLHESTFRRCITEIGLNPYVLEMANIREFSSWCHLSTPREATNEAKKIVKIAVAKARLLQALETIEFPVTNKALIIGGGIAGISAALDLADMGFKVYLVEKSESIGGHMAQLDKTFPTLDCSICIEGPKMVDVSRHPNIEIISYANILHVEGFVGNFRVKVRKNPRYVIADNCTGCGECRDVCPIEFPNKWDLNMGVRKAISLPFDQAVPLVYTINMDHCIECYKCVDVCGARQAINFDQQPEEIELNVGAIIVAIGFESYLPYTDHQYGYGKYDNVITALEFERLILAAGPTSGKVIRASDGEKPHSIVFIQCVGSRDVNKYEYCSGFCCMYTLKHAVMLKEKYKDDIQIYIIYTDMRSDFKGYEEFYNRAQKAGVHFVRVKLENRSVTEDPGTKNLIVHAETEGDQPVEIAAEMVVLANAAIPVQDAADLAKLLNIPIETDGFFVECQPKIRPSDTDIPGIFLAGACLGLKDIPYSVAQGSGAAAQASTILSRSTWIIEPFIAKVDEGICSGCKICKSVCDYNAVQIEKTHEKELAKVIDGLCRGCGTCSAACPTGAITMPLYTDAQVIAQVRAALEEVM